MKVPSRIRLTFYFFAFAGAALFVGLLIREGAPQVGKAIASAGWAILAVIAYHLCVPVFLDALAWWVLFPKIDRPPLPRIFWVRWIGESVSTLVPSAAVGGDIVRARLAAIHGALVGCCAWTILSLILNSGEIWIALHALNLKASVINAVILQITILTVRNVGFAVPSGLGVQEGGYVLIGSLLGIDGTNALALSLIARVRELALGIPGLVTWQVIEGRRLLRTRAEPASL